MHSDSLVTSNVPSDQTLSADESSGLNSDNAWAVNFKPREYTQQVKNCTLVNRAVKDAIINKVFEAVLVAMPTTGSEVKREDGKVWQRGGMYNIN